MWIFSILYTSILLKALEEKYNAQKKIQLALQGQLLDVFSRLGQAQKPTLYKDEGNLKINSAMRCTMTKTVV